VDGLWATKNKGVGLIVRAINIQDFQPMWSWSTNVRDRRTDGRTDGQTDGRKTCNLNTALCTTKQKDSKRANIGCILYFAYMGTRNPLDGSRPNFVRSGRSHVYQIWWRLVKGFLHG